MTKVQAPMTNGMGTAWPLAAEVYEETRPNQLSELPNCAVRRHYCAIRWHYPKEE